MLLQQYIQPDRSKWKDLLARPILQANDLTATVHEIMSLVSSGGDHAILEFTSKFDGVNIEDIGLSRREINDAAHSLQPSLRQAIDQAHDNIEKFHRPQIMDEEPVETLPGVLCWREHRAIDPIGLYIPGGTAPLFSTVLMLGIPARIAGCTNIVMCTPPNKEGEIAPEILYAASKCGIHQIFRAGGAQAIASMTFGTESIPKVAKIFGPGNQYVTEAKIQAQKYGVAIDMPAGPSEVLVIADEASDPAFIASDLLSQAEHGTDSQVMLLTTSQKILDETNRELALQLESLPRQKLARTALENSAAIYFEHLDTCLDFSNQYAPEHLILNLSDWKQHLPKIQCAGSVFLGQYSPEAVGDYASGTNHTLPTNGWAKSFSGVSVDSFVKKITFQNVTEKGLDRLGDIVEAMAEAESLEGHKNAVTIRRTKIQGA